MNAFNYAENEPVGSIDLHGLQRLKVNFTYRTRAASDLKRDIATVGVAIRNPKAASRIGAFKSGSTNISSVSSRIARHAFNSSIYYYFFLQRFIL